MNTFIHDDFMLHGDVAKQLYHHHAKHMPIIDYHCHLDPKDIYEDKKFRNLFEVWLEGDHYKWRLMRANGATEDLITGNGDQEKAKFMAWAKTVPDLIGNPLYHWTHLELKRFFDIDTLLGPNTAEAIYEEVNQKLTTLSARKMIDMSKVEIICTTDDPIDTLEWHDKLAADPTFQTKVYPTFRPDKAINIERSPFCDWIGKLANVAGYDIKNLTSLKQALVERMDHFRKRGCRLADHALDVVYFTNASDKQADHIFKKALKGESLTKTELKQYKGHMLVYLGRMYHRYGWAQQYHIGAFRNVSSRMYAALGPDTGFDAINDEPFAYATRNLLNALDLTKELPKTILYTLNPRDFETAVTLMQAFPSDGVPGKIQFGSAWWFLDNIDGMTKQIKALGNNALLARFIGMLTDSRSFLSYPRHEYFRRLLCNIIGEEVRLGYFPYDEPLLGRMVEDICYHNAKAYFGF